MVNKLSPILDFIKKHPFILVPFIFYFYTCSPTIGLGDTALLMEGIQELKINTHVNNHNITILIGRLFSYLPFGELAYRINLMSAFVGALTIAFFYGLIYLVFNSRISAVISALLLMVSHSMWWHSTLSEVYAVNALLTVLLLHLLWRFQQYQNDKYLLGMFFLSGLAVFNHVQLGTFAVGSTIVLLGIIIEGVFKRKEDPSRKDLLRFRLILFCGLSFLAGFLPYLITFIKDANVYGFEHSVHTATGSDFKKIMFKGSFLSSLSDLGYLFFKQFPSLYLAFLIPGFVLFLRKWRFTKNTIALITIFVMTTWFFMFYQTWDKFAFLLPSFVILTFWGAFAVSAVEQYLIRKRSLILTSIGLLGAVFSISFPVYFYSQLSHWGQEPDNPWYKRYNNNYTINTHNISEYIANPNKRHYRDIEELSELVFEKLPSDAILFDDDSRTFYPLHVYYQRYFQKRPDVRIEIINSWNIDNWGHSKGGFADQLIKAYQTNKDFFLISLQHPFRGFLAKVPDRKKYQFERFPLNDKRWIYRLVTLEESLGKDKKIWKLWDKLDTTQPLHLNFTLQNVLYSQKGSIVLQPTSGFGDLWNNEDHVFFGAEERGAELAFLIRTSQESRNHLEFQFTTAPDFGIVDVYLNDQKLTAQKPIDLYSVSVTVMTVNFQDVFFEKGNNVLKFKMIGKKFISKGMKMGVDALTLEPAETA